MMKLQVLTTLMALLLMSLAGQDGAVQALPGSCLGTMCGSGNKNPSLTSDYRLAEARRREDDQENTARFAKVERIVKQQNNAADYNNIQLPKGIHEQTEEDITHGKYSMVFKEKNKKTPVEFAEPSNKSRKFKEY